MIEALSILLAQQATDLINQNVDGFAGELKADPEGKMSISLSFKVTLMRELICSTGGLAYARKFKDEVQGTAPIEDPQQPKLGIEDKSTAAARTGGGSITPRDAKEILKAVKLSKGEA
jgi:hypothetical protein